VASIVEVIFLQENVVLEGENSKMKPPRCKQRGIRIKKDVIVQRKCNSY
jgi:hypothetical protein